MDYYSVSNAKPHIVLSSSSFYTPFDSPFYLKMASSSAPEDNYNVGDLMDLLWQDEVAVAMQMQQPDNQSCIHGWPLAGPEESQLFMEEDEMTGWLQYQIGTNEQGGGGSVYCSELLNMPVAAAVGSSDSCRLTMLPSAGLTEASPAATATGSEKREVIDLEAMKSKDDRKRKARDDDGGKSVACHSKDAGNQHGNKRKEAHQPLTTRMRDAEIHNLSERRRRDKINEKMKTLQELIPRCNKSNKASMLDDAIEYTKSLQLQAEMMSSMQYNMNPLTSPNVQRYFPTMGFMGMGMGMNMGMASGVEVGEQPGMPLGLVLPYASIVGHPQSHLHPPLMPAFPSANMAYANQLRTQASNLLDPASNPANIQGPNMVQIPIVADKHHCHVGTNHPQESAQNRPMGEPGQKKINITQKPQAVERSRSVMREAVQLGDPKDI